MSGKINQKIGILGGGQLGKMICQAGSKLNLNISVLDQNRSFPAASVCPDFKEGNITDYADVINFGKDKDIITIEIENVNVDALFELEASGIKVYPQPAILEVIKDKGRQKLFYQQHNIPTATFELFEDASAIKRSIIDGNLQFPFVQKARFEGYDGRGVVVVQDAEKMKDLLDTACVVEYKVDIQTEIAVIVARSASGLTQTFPVVEMDFHPDANLVEFLICPSAQSDEIQKSANKLALQIAENLGITGLLAVEMFIDTNGNILVNEVAPRPHNSGHHTIEACITSQYEQHLRSILDLPLGNTELIRPAVMVNLLGEPGYSGPAIYQGLEECLKISGVYPHIYGKNESKPFRKMGHVTVTDENPQKALEKAKFVKNTLKVIA